MRIILESKEDSRRFDKLKALSLPQGQDPETQRSPEICRKSYFFVSSRLRARRSTLSVNTEPKKFPVSIRIIRRITKHQSFTSFESGALGVSIIFEIELDLSNSPHNLGCNKVKK